MLSRYPFRMALSISPLFFSVLFSYPFGIKFLILTSLFTASCSSLLNISLIVAFIAGSFLHTMLFPILTHVFSPLLGSWHLAPDPSSSSECRELLRPLQALRDRAGIGEFQLFKSSALIDSAQFQQLWN